MTISKIFRISKEYEPLRGCTVSCEDEITRGRSGSVIHFSLGEGTAISPEIFPRSKLLIMLLGSMCVCGAKLEAGGAFITPSGTPAGMKAYSECVYTEIDFEEGDTFMNESVKPGEVFRLNDLVPYREGRVISMDVMSSEHMKFAVMSFAPGTGLSEHAAPGDALVFALDGEGIIGYEGQEHRIKAGENFRFSAGGLHYVKAEGNFKMALLLSIE